ncbi:MAG: PaaI family thioesterase [Humidesulfovibrio sp.]|uniref:PaaI family thioesterase n=1 Tax=Humidesulfovibrio sp. TaxID=2910988 RepID=UPI0027E94E34|nr:PaaI family thioesterase [Humidesulfovibrio sp.]MDQ7834393.1 PaaI family thioesterase [Humidesulfovibrio sp.]
MDFIKLRELIETGIPFNEVLGIKVDELREGYVRLRVPFRPELLGDTRRPALHGGVISTLVDVAGGFAVWTCCRLDDRIATIDLGVDYLRPAPDRDLVAEATVRLLGNRVGNAHVAVFSADDPDKHVAVGRAVYNIRRGK